LVEEPEHQISLALGPRVVDGQVGELHPDAAAPPDLDGLGDRGPLLPGHPAGVGRVQRVVPAAMAPSPAISSTVPNIDGT